jgi:hypothetical protein
MAMNSAQDASPDLPDAEVTDTDTDIDTDTDADSETLQRSREAIDQGREAAREALNDDADVAAEPEG